ncbi:MAG: T9SS type A sorting domain-containing protein [Ignavibacteriales bacterium]|nr:T9SS type A sorting domain-containing protein [Ignavibacteriales bacterium]
MYSNNLINITGDTTLPWRYFQDLKPFSGTQVTATLSWRLKLEALEGMHLFDRGLGDKVMILGPNGWVVATDGIPMTFVPALQEWVGQQTFTKYVGEDMIYKYYIQWDTSRVDTGSIHFIPALRLDDGWEEPGVTGGADRHYIFTDQTQQSPTGDFGYAQQFFNSIPPQGVITTPMNVVFKVNMTNAARLDSNAANTLFRPGIDTVYVQFDGSILAITQGKTMWGTDNRITLTDPDGDMIYTGSMALTPPYCYQAAYRIVYTSTTGEVWNGGGVQSGRRYYQYIRPTGYNPLVWGSSYEFPVVPWRAANLTVEVPPDLLTTVESNTGVATGFAVEQNYPNPFNPSTVIRYTIPSKVLVKIHIFDVNGSLVKTLADNEQQSGTHEIVWNGTGPQGNKVASGVYLMAIRAGELHKTIKMVMLK